MKLWLTRTGGICMLTQSVGESPAEAAVFCFHSENALKEMLGFLPAEGATPVPVEVTVSPVVDLCAQ